MVTSLRVDPTALPADILAALRAVFGAAPVEELAPLGGGLSRSTLLAFTVGGARYVLRKGDLARAPRELACMQIASDRGVAPRLHHADPRTGISIMDRVAGAQLGPPEATRLEKTAETLRRLHGGPAFPRAATVMEAVRALEVDIGTASGEGLPPELLRTVDELAACTTRYWETAPCHNDLNPNNVLVTADRVFFVDWETAGAGDPFIDLAQLGVFAFPGPDQREALLEAYLARRPTGEERARATVARVIALAVYAAAFFRVCAISGARARAEGLPLADLFRLLATSRERADPGLIAASLLLEVQRESATPACASARATLAAG